MHNAANFFTQLEDQDTGTHDTGRTSDGGVLSAPKSRSVFSAPLLLQAASSLHRCRGSDVAHPNHDSSYSWRHIGGVNQLSASFGGESLTSAAWTICKQTQKEM